MTRSISSAASGRGVMWLVFWVSAAVLGFEIALMRLLLIVSWHHFAFLVISIALLGFGASGTLLTLLRKQVTAHRRGVLLVTALATALSMPLCTALAQLVPVEARLVPALLLRQGSAWILCWFLLTVPFLLGAACIGAALMGAGQRIAAIYGSNMLGSAVGAAMAPAVMLLIRPELLPAAMAAPALLGAAGLLVRGFDRRSAVAAVALVAIGLGLSLQPIALRPDPYKYSAYLNRLIEQGSAERLVRRYGPRALIEAYRSDALHDLPFLGPGVAPPSMTALTFDGHWAGSLLHVRSANEAAAVDQTLMAAAYELAPPAPRVALLGEIGGSNIWLAVRGGASRIDVVQPDPSLPPLLRRALRDQGGSVLDVPNVVAVIAEPRHHLDHGADRYDLIQLVALEGSAAGSGGVGGLGEDHLMTVQGVGAALRRLTDEGILFVCRGMQEPPRDNLKVFATFIEALRREGVEDPERHLVIVRDFLGVCTLLKATPWSAAQIQAVRTLCSRRQLTPVWFEGIQPQELNQPDALPPPPQGQGDWYHHAAMRLFHPDTARRFVDDYPFDIRPPTDDRPFFFDFCRLRSIRALRESYGELWLTRVELAFLFVLVALGVITIIGAALTVLPLWGLPRSERGGASMPIASYFAAIGLAYLTLEMTCLSRLTHLIGDPVTTAAVTISGFLLFSGLGCLTAQRAGRRGVRRHRWLLLALAATGALVLLGLQVIPVMAGGLPTIARCAVALLAIAPLAYLMGFPMPLALQRLEAAAPAAIPWAWAVNGFASVLAAPLATATGMTIGYTAAALAAIALYAAAAFIQQRLPPRTASQVDSSP